MIDKPDCYFCKNYRNCDMYKSRKKACEETDWEEFRLSIKKLLISELNHWIISRFRLLGGRGK